MRSWSIWYHFIYCVNEFNVLGILFSVMSVWKKGLGKLFWLCLLFTNSLENKFNEIGNLMNAHLWGAKGNLVSEF